MRRSLYAVIFDRQISHLAEEELVSDWQCHGDESWQDEVCHRCVKSRGGGAPFMSRVEQWRVGGRLHGRSCQAQEHGG
jgi:hypothetical protein